MAVCDDIKARRDRLAALRAADPGAVRHLDEWHALEITYRVECLTIRGGAK